MLPGSDGSVNWLRHSKRRSVQSCVDRFGLIYSVDDGRARGAMMCRRQLLTETWMRVVDLACGTWSHDCHTAIRGKSSSAAPPERISRPLHCDDARPRSRGACSRDEPVGSAGGLDPA